MDSAHFIHLYHILTKKGAGVSEGPDLWVRQAGEHGQQGREEELVINKAVLTGTHQNMGKLAQGSFKTPHVWARGAQRIAHWVLEEERKESRGEYRYWK